MFEDIITLYHFTDDNYDRTVIKNVYWDEVGIGNVLKSGLTNTDSIRIIIPTKTDIKISEGKDLIVKGKCEFVDKTNVKRTLCEQYNAYTVSKVDRKLHGDLSNIEISCK
ncbi:MAG: hypothetical protein J6B87_02900 [Clostridia bacterium]|nr:hypothetical protein [Clostridia bacterium]